MGNQALGCHYIYFLIGLLLLPNKPHSITALRPVPKYTDVRLMDAWTSYGNSLRRHFPTASNQRPIELGKH